MIHAHRRVALALVLLAAGAFASASDKAAQYLYLWTGSADSTQPDFLAVLDVTEGTGRYGRLVTTLAVPGRDNGPHHTEHEMPADRQLFANGFKSGQSFVFDLTDPSGRASSASSATSRGTRTRIRSSGCPMATCWRHSRCVTTPPR